MVLMSTLLNNIKTLVNQYVYTKEETRKNFDYFIEHNVRYINGNFIVNEEYTYPDPPILFQPAFDGTTPVIKQYTNSNANTQSDGVATFKGCVIDEGWDNTGLWEVTVDIAYLSGIRYTGLILLTNLDTPFAGWGIRNWEGPVTGTPGINNGNGETATSTNYTKTPDNNLTDLSGYIFNNPTVNWYTLHMKKTSPTTLEVYKEFSDSSVSATIVYEWAELSDVSRCTMGGMTNSADTAAYGSVYMRNLKVTEYWGEL